MNTTIYSGKSSELKRMKTIFIALAFLVFYCTTLTAQELKFYKVENELSKSSDIINDKGIDITNLESLLYDLNPTIYIANNVSNVYGNGPAVMLEIDAQSLEQLYKTNSAFNKIEVIKLVLNNSGDLGINLNVDKLDKLDQLKYIFVEFAFDVCGGQKDSCLPAITKDLVTGADSNVVVLFNLSIPN
jgi:hypothetical protein